MPNDFNQNMLNTIKRCEGFIIEDEAFKKGFSEIYPFTTENISGYIDFFDLKDKSLLTVGSSLDQLLNAVLFDCKDITVLDINPNTKHYFYLKLAALLELNRKEFLEFLRYKDFPKVFKDNYQVFNKTLFNEFKSTLRLLDYESYLLWDEVIQNYESRKIRNRLFSLDEERTSVIISCNPYLSSETSYLETRNKIKKVFPKFITCDIEKASLDRSYDNIWLSNIGTHVDLNTLKKIVDKVSQHLNIDGTLLISYLYSTTISTKYQDDWQEIYNLDETFKIFAEYNPTLKDFLGIRDFRFNFDSQHDSVLIYKNKKNIIT